MNKKVYALSIFTLLGNAAVQADNVQINENLSIKPSIDMMYGAMYSKKSYNNPEAQDDISWQEAYASYGVEGQYRLGKNELYATVKGLSSATFGDGDAAGFSDGSERKTTVGEWSLGWRNGAADKAKIDLSIGRQSVQIADGFLVAGDALNMGKGIADGELNRGGGYYIAARKSFDFTTVLHYQLTDSLKSHWYYLKSDNQAQYQPTLWATDWQYQFKNYDFGLTYLQIAELEDPQHESVRDDLKDIAVRAKTQINDQLAFSSEYVYQDQQHENENAWYMALNYQFEHMPFQPTLGYRFSSFSENYDALFYGNTDAGFGTWFQGEVAGNYAGPFSSNARIHQVSLQASVKENLHLGMLAYQFDTIKKDTENLDAHELDIFAVWSPTPHINVIPLLGIFKPKKALLNGGSQVNGTQSNTYAQLLLQYVY